MFFGAGLLGDGVLPGGQDFGGGVGSLEAVGDGAAGAPGAQARARKKRSYKEGRKAGKELTCGRSQRLGPAKRSEAQR